MVTTVHCPHCARKLRPPDALRGKLGRCSACFKPFTIPPLVEPIPEPPPPRQAEPPREIPPPPREVEPPRRKKPPSARPKKSTTYGLQAPPPQADDSRPRVRLTEDDSEEEERAERRERTPGARQRWWKVRTGMTLHGIAAGLLSGVAFMALIAVVILQANRTAVLAGPGLAFQFSPGLQNLSGVLAIMILLLGAAAEVLSLIGICFCLFVSGKHGANGLAITTLVLMVSAWFIALLVLATTPYLLIGTWVVLVARMFVFCFFLRALAQSLKEDGLAESIERLLFLWGGLYAAGLLLALVHFSILQAALEPGGEPWSPEARSTIRWIFTLFQWGLQLVSLLGFAWYVQVVFQTRGAVSERVGA